MNIRPTPRRASGDLLDVIRESMGLIDFKDVDDEARSFLAMPHTEAEPHQERIRDPAPTGSTEASRRLPAMSKPIIGTLVETYMRGRAITTLHGTGALRFHPHCYPNFRSFGRVEVFFEDV